MNKLVFLTLIFLSLSAFAGRDCRVQQVTCDMKINGEGTAHVLYQRLERIRLQEEAAGRKFEVAIVGRMGTDLNNVRVFKEKDSFGNFLSMDQIVAASKSVTDDRIIILELEKLYDKNKKLKYSHVGIFIYNHPKSINYGRGYHWWATHELNHCQTVKSEVFHESTSFFFFDDPHDYGAQIIVLKPEVQKIILKIVNEEIKKQELAKAENRDGDAFIFHSNPYNAFAMYDNELSGAKKHQGQQNSNQFVLEVIAAAASEALYNQKVSTRAEAQDFLKKSGYRPSNVHATGFKASFVTTALAPKSMDATSQKYPLFNLGEIVTALSVEEYAKNANLLQRPVEEVHLQDEYFLVTATDKEKKEQVERMEEIKKLKGFFPMPCDPRVMGALPVTAVLPGEEAK